MTEVKTEINWDGVWFIEKVAEAIDTVSYYISEKFSEDDEVKAELRKEIFFYLLQPWLDSTTLFSVKVEKNSRRGDSND